MSALAKYFPFAKQFIAHGGEDAIKKVELNKITSKIVFFYFTASWCPPCRGFTPQLIEFYNKYHESKNFEIIAISWDEEKKEWEEYYKKMPWLALSFEEKKNIEHLTKGFQVQSIPTLIGVDGEDGSIVTTTARRELVEDPEGKNFPWRDQPAKQ